MKFLKVEKGSYKYIEKQRIIEIVKTAFMFFCCIAIYMIGYSVLKTNKSIWTILAILGVLPASKSAVNMIMFIRNKSLTKDEFEKIESSRGNIPVLHELVFTTQETQYYVNSCACLNSTIICYSNVDEKKQKKLKEHLNTSISREELTGYSLKIYSSLDDYCKRLREMNSNMNDENDRSHERLFLLFKAITL